MPVDSPVERSFPALVSWSDHSSTGRTLEPIGNPAKSAVSISAATFGNTTRVAIAYWGESPVEVFDYESLESGGHKLTRRVAVSDVDKCWVRLTTDGERLAILHQQGLKIVRVGDNDVSTEFEFGSILKSKFNPSTQPLDISGDGSRVVSAVRGGVAVRSLDDGEVLLRVQRVARAVSLSGDGSLLAVLHFERPRVCVYRVPGLAKRSLEARNE